MYLKNTIPLLLLLFFHSTFSQNNYQPLNTVSKDESQLLDQYENRLQSFIKNISTSDKDKKTDKENFYNRRNNRLTHYIENGHLIFDEDINLFFQDILDEVVRKNPSLQDLEMRLFVSRYFWPNATCYGEGTLIFNLGLLRRLENEDQVAFIVCHEIAHYYMDHVEHDMHERVEYLHSEELQEQLNRIKKEEYGQYDKASQLLKDYIYDDRRHGRLHEEEADSLGYEFMKHTRYDVSQAVRALEILDEIDHEKYEMDIHIRTLFTFENYTFRDRWLDKEEGMLYQKNLEARNDGEWNSDSLKTHPDCDERMRLMTGLSGKESIPIKGNETFLEFVKQADYEIVQSSFDFGFYGRSLYYAMQLLQHDSDNEYLIRMIGQNLVYLCHAQKKHEFAKHVEKPHSRNEAQYDLLLNFLQNLRFRELALLGYHYHQEHATPTRLEHEDFLFHALLSSYLAKQESSLESYKDMYQKQFGSDGQYNDIIQTLQID